MFNACKAHTQFYEVKGHGLKAKGQEGGSGILWHEEKEQGKAVFLLPWASQWLRSLLKPVHVFFGACILSLSIASVISGINEKLFFVL